MIQSATLSRTVPLHPRGPAAKASGESGDFADAFEQVSDAAKPDPTATAPEDESRQDDAATGNALPPLVIAPDPAFVWQPIIATPGPVSSVSASIAEAAAALPTTAQRPVFTQLQPQATTPAPPPAPTEPQPPLPSAPAQAGGAPVMQLAAAIIAALPPVKPTTQAVDTPKTDTPPSDVPRWTMPDSSPVTLAVAQPDIVQPQPGTVASAAMVFGAAIQAATKKRDEPDTPAAPSDTPLTPVGAAATHEIKVADAQQAPLDMRQERWPHAMIERIDTLRDAANATDTRIRLIPDALGAIDVSIKTNGDTVNVHFNAEQAATRTLLADSQPQLVELAEARGLKLGQGTLGDGAASGNQPRAPATQQLPNRTPASSTAMTGDAAEDTRIA